LHNITHFEKLKVLKHIGLRYIKLKKEKMSAKTPQIEKYPFFFKMATKPKPNFTAQYI